MNNENISKTLIDTKDNNVTSLEQQMIAEALKHIKNPFQNITVADVAKDLKMGLNLANDVFRRDDFPSVNIGKEKTVTLLAYLLWKMQKRTDTRKNNK